MDKTEILYSFIQGILIGLLISLNPMNPGLFLLSIKNLFVVTLIFIFFLQVNTFNNAFLLQYFRSTTSLRFTFRLLAGKVQLLIAVALLTSVIATIWKDKGFSDAFTSQFFFTVLTLVGAVSYTVINFFLVARMKAFNVAGITFFITLVPPALLVGSLYLFEATETVYMIGLIFPFNLNFYMVASEVLYVFTAPLLYLTAQVYLLYRSRRFSLN